MIIGRLPANAQAIYYRFLHAFSMLLLLSGLYTCWVFPLYTIPHLLAVFWMIYFHIKHGYCILTKLEKEAITRSGKKPYKSGFYQHYLFNNIFNKTVSDSFAKKFLIYGKVVPGLIPAAYPLIKLFL